MKKIILGALFAFIAFVACKKEADIPAIKFKFSVEIPNEKYSDKGLNDRVNIPIDISPSYNLTKMPIKYKINWDKQGELKIGDTEVRRDEIYTLDTTKIMLSYTGKEVGEHKISLSFFNDKDMNIEKEIKIPYVKYNFNTSIVGGKENIYQGENIEYNLSIAPENATINDVYKIKFISYDDQDPTLAKSFVGFNGLKIEFGKEYVISDLSVPQRINLKPFYFGRKELVYKIINRTSEKEEKIQQVILQSKIEIKTLNFNKLITNSLGERLQINGYIEKTPDLNREIYYKSWIVEPIENKDGITNTNNEYQKYTLPANKEFSIDLEVKKFGTFKYMIQFKDEFGTESAPTSFVVKVVNKDFNIEQKINSNINNIFQGSNIDVDFEIKEELPTEEEYQIQFLSFDSSDMYLEKSKIRFNNADIQLNKWYPANKNTINKIILSPFHFGNKKLKYQIKNSLYTKDKELDLNVKKTVISIQNLSIRYHKEGVVYINEPFSIGGKIEKTFPDNKKMEYKTWVSQGDVNKINSVTNSYREIDFSGRDNVFSSNFSISEVGHYILNIQFKDEFGNESEIRTFPINAVSKLEIEEAEANYIINVSFNKYCDGEETDRCQYYIEGQRDFHLKIKAKSGTGNLLNKAEVNFNGFDFSGFNIIPKTEKTENISLKDSIDKKITIMEGNNNYFNDSSFPTDFYTGAGFIKRYLKEWVKTNPKLNVKIYDNMGNSIEKDIPIKVVWGDMKLN